MNHYDFQGRSAFQNTQHLLGSAVVLRKIALLADVPEAVEVLMKRPYSAELSNADELLGARIRFNAARYDAEARYNQVIANLLELQVRKANLSAERHHRRSGKFFFGMLGAQAGVIVATFAMAAQKRNLLWSLAAVAGLCAVLFAVYVYLKV